jgi:hypothetical protein
VVDYYHLDRTRLSFEFQSHLLLQGTEQQHLSIGPCLIRGIVDDKIVIAFEIRSVEHGASDEPRESLDQKVHGGILASQSARKETNERLLGAVFRLPEFGPPLATTNV